MQTHPSLGGVLAFSAPHGLYQETVGLMLVDRPGQQRCPTVLACMALD